MTGIILVAGYGSRLGDLTKDTPKCLIDVSGKCPLGRTLENLIKSGVKKVKIVTGYQAGKILTFTESDEFKDIEVDIIFNEDWETTNNAYSLNMAMEDLDDDILVLNGDVVCHPDLIKTMADPKLKSAMAVVRKKELNEEDMKVVVEGHKVIKVSKELSTRTEEYSTEEVDSMFQSNNKLPELSYGEFTGIFRLNKKLVPFLREDLAEVLKTNKNAWFEHALVGLCAQRAIYCKDVSHFPYIEIDFPEDLAEARDRFPYDQPVWEQGRRHESIKEGKRNIEDAIALMTDFRDILDKYEMRYWLNWGLLLGCVREGQPLQYDTDLDICIDKENEDRFWNKVVPEMKKLRCYVPDRKDHCDNDCFIMRDGEAIECNMMQKIDGRYVYSPERCQLSCPEKHLDHLDVITVKGKVFRIPSFAEEMLAGWYGDDWRIPQSVKPRSF